MSNNNQTYTTRSSYWYSARAEAAPVDDDSDRTLFGTRRDGIFRKLEERAESRTAVLDFDDIESDIERFFRSNGQSQRYGHSADFGAI